MTPQELTNIVAFIKETKGKLNASVSKFNELTERVEGVIDRSDPLSLPLSQTETDHIVNTYAQLYLNALKEIETITDLLGTYALH